MTKKELIDAMAGMPDDAEVIVQYLCYFQGDETENAKEIKCNPNANEIIIRTY